MSADEPVVIVCAPVRRGEVAPIPGSTTDHVCQICETAVWLAPSGQAVAVAIPAALFWCYPCTLAVAPTIPPQPLNADQLAEIRDALMRRRH